MNNKKRFPAWAGLALTAMLLALSLLVLVGLAYAQAPTGPYPASPAFPPPLTGWPEFATTDIRRPEGTMAWDSQFVGAPTIISDAGQLEMWYLGANPAWTAHIGQATSPDGIHWTKSASNPLLPGWEPAVRKEGPADYKMWFSVDDIYLYRATSTDGLNWAVDATPALSPTLLDGTFDRDSVGDPSIVLDGGGTYWMFYNGYNAEWDLWQIGAATSTDGIHWTRVQAAPVLSPGGPGDWDEHYALDPMVLLDGGVFKMWYSAFDAGGVRRIGYATSPDGVNWTKYAGNPVFEGEPGQWDDGNVSNMFVAYEGGYHMWYTCNGQIGYVTSTNGIDWTRFLTGPVLSPGPGLFIDVNYAHEWVAGWTLPNATVAITVADGGGVKAVASGQADEWGNFGSWGMSWDPGQPNIAVGDVVVAAAAGLTTAVDPIGAIDATMDTAADTVYGAIHVPWFVTVTVRCEIWQENGPSIEIPGVDADGGEYACDFTGQWDIQPWEMVAVRYLEPDGDTVINIAHPLDLLLQVNYAHDWVEGDYEAGHTVWITLTESDGVTIKDTAELTTGEVPWWGGRVGFSTGWQGWTSGGWPDLQAGDWVYGRVDTGYAATVRIGTITGDLDIGADTISGTITADWFTQTLSAWCGVWEPGGPSTDFQVDPDGGAYFCDIGALGWDLVPGHDVSVGYLEPDRDWVTNIFREPAPNLRVEKWAEGSGQAMPGGPAVFTLRYRNEGDAEAATITLTDTLPANTTYVADGSGVAPILGPGWVAWTLGPLGVGEERRFQLVLHNTANPGATLHNAADIWALYDDDYGNNHAEADVQVVEGRPDLYVNKNPNPGDPAPGQTMLWEINYGHNGPVASGPVVLTDTIPQGTSIVAWYSENGYNLWTDHSTADQLILEAPAIPGYWGDRILLRLLVDNSVPVGTQLTNTVEITTAGDTNPGDNWQMRNDVWTGWPRYDTGVSKWWGHGSLAPGRESNFWVGYRNSGNSLVHNAVLTDTLPAGTTFITSLLDLGWGIQVPFPPDSIVGNELVWNLGTLEVAEGHNIMLRLQIDPGTAPGTLLTDCAAIASRDFEDNPYDNAACITETVRAAGPNLRVTKFTHWDSPDRIYYGVRVCNIGTTTEYSVTLTDTFPAGMTLENWHVDFWEPWSWNLSGNRFTVTFSRLEPEWTTWLHLWLSVPAVPNGTLFTNVADITIPPGDVNPADNHDEIVVGTGPDLSVEKWLSGGTPTPDPGQLLTFTLHFQNRSEAWWTAGTVWVSDTLPAGLEFVGARQRLCGGTYFCERGPDYSDGTTLAWSHGQMGNGWWNDLIVTVRVADTARGGDVLTNTATIASDSADDVEPYYDDNTSTCAVTVNLRFIYLPLIVKKY